MARTGEKMNVYLKLLVNPWVWIVVLIGLLVAQYKWDGYRYNSLSGKYAISQTDLAAASSALEECKHQKAAISDHYLRSSAIDTWAASTASRISNTKRIVGENEKINDLPDEINRMVDYFNSHRVLDDNASASGKN